MLGCQSRRKKKLDSKPWRRQQKTTIIISPMKSWYFSDINWKEDVESYNWLRYEETLHLKVNMRKIKSMSRLQISAQLWPLLHKYCESICQGPWSQGNRQCKRTNLNSKASRSLLERTSLSFKFELWKITDIKYKWIYGKP